MITSAEIQLIREADPGAILPGIDTPTGNLDPVSSLKSLATITQNSKGAPYYYNPTNNTVVVTQNGAVLSGINFGSATLVLSANNVTVKDCTFTATTGFWGVYQGPSYSGATVENCTFTGSQSPTETNVWISADKTITIKDNTFLYSPTDAVDIEAGVVTGNYFSGAGYATGAHADAIYVGVSTGPTTITDNFIDGTYNANAAANANSDIRLTTEFGSLSNVTVSGNYLLGGGFSTETAAGANPSYTFSNISIANNYIGFFAFSSYWNGGAAVPSPNISVTPNTIVSYSNPTFSAQALAAYKKTAILPGHVIAATTAGQTLTSASSAPTTLLGNGLATTFVGSTNETNFVPGYGPRRILGGQGANIVTYLAISDTTPINQDLITSFDPAKDVIDLSRIDANITTPGVQHFTFIGSAPIQRRRRSGALSVQPRDEHHIRPGRLSRRFHSRFPIQHHGTCAAYRRKLRLDASSVGSGHRQRGRAGRHQGSNRGWSAGRVRLRERQGQELFVLRIILRQQRRFLRHSGRRPQSQFDLRRTAPLRAQPDSDEGRRRRNPSGGLGAPIRSLIIPSRQSTPPPAARNNSSSRQASATKPSKDFRRRGQLLTRSNWRPRHSHISPRG